MTVDICKEQFRVYGQSQQTKSLMKLTS